MESLGISWSYLENSGNGWIFSNCVAKDRPDLNRSCCCTTQSWQTHRLTILWGSPRWLYSIPAKSIWWQHFLPTRDCHRTNTPFFLRPMA